jgi:hypothetical protein
MPFIKASAMFPAPMKPTLIPTDLSSHAWLAIVSYLRDSI